MPISYNTSHNESPTSLFYPIDDISFAYSPSPSARGTSTQSPSQLPPINFGKTTQEWWERYSDSEYYNSAGTIKYIGKQTAPWEWRDGWMTTMQVATYTITTYSKPYHQITWNPMLSSNKFWFSGVAAQQGNHDIFGTQLSWKSTLKILEPSSGMDTIDSQTLSLINSALTSILIKCSDGWISIP